jgi:formylglycine-generating enzyme required for sulfatase activity
LFLGSVLICLAGAAAHNLHESPQTSPRVEQPKKENPGPSPGVTKPTTAASLEKPKAIPVVVPAKPKPGDTITNALGMKFAYAPPGNSWLGGGGGKMGTVPFTLSEPIWCGVFPVTHAQLQTVVEFRPPKQKGPQDPNYPVEMISLSKAQEFLSKLNSQLAGDGLAYRLPTEEEWEYVCRGGPITQDQSKYHFYFAKSKKDFTPTPSNSLSSQEANFNGNYPAGSASKGPFLDRRSEVGTYLPNPLGVYDMHGNVSQWTITSGGSGYVIRGGSWFAKADQCTATIRRTPGPKTSLQGVGFRLMAVPAVR